jgi:hypothetical protein
MSTAPLEPLPVTLSVATRRATLEQYVAEQTRRGWRVQSQTATQAQLLKGKHTSHVLHLLLTLITVGFWIPIWILVAVTGGEKTRFVTVDETGAVRTT